MTRLRSTLVVPVLAGMALVALGGWLLPASAHGFTSVVYADVSAPSNAEEGDPSHVKVALRLEYDLLEVSASDDQGDDAFYREAQPRWEAGDLAGMTAALEDHDRTVLGYVTKRFGVSAAGVACTPAREGDYTVRQEPSQGVPYLTLVLGYDCSGDATIAGHVVTSTLFPDTEGYVTGTKTIVTYDIDRRSGSAALDATRPSFSTEQSWGSRFSSFWRLGVMHILTGPDHLLFLTALIVGSRRLREIVLGASTFTIAHGVTLILAAFGVVHVSSDVVEPLIALSIAGVAAWHLWRIVTKHGHASDLTTRSRSHLALDRAGWVRVGIVFGFGLVHGLGFAGALGIDHAFSWSLLWSLLVFSIGIETVQLGLIVLIFPALALLRHRRPLSALWVTGAIAAVVAGCGLVWFVQRVLG